MAASVSPPARRSASGTVPSGPPPALVALCARFDPEVFPIGGGHARVRLQGAGIGRWDAVLQNGRARLEWAHGRPDAVVITDAPTWLGLAEGDRDGMEAFRDGRLSVRRDLHLGVGFLAATTAGAADRGIRYRIVDTEMGEISTLQAGSGPPVLLIHGLGATKVSFLPTVGALADRHRVIAMDLPGFGDSVKPLRAPYDAAFFARSTVALLDALGLPRASMVGNSMGGRVALEAGLAHPGRVDRLVLLAPAVAWLRGRAFAPAMRLLRPELGLLQLAPRQVFEPLVRRLVPGAEEGWTAAGVDEFLRSYLTARGRAAFYAAARNIYLDEPHGADGFWPRLAKLDRPSLFVWGHHDHLVPIAFARHVRETLPSARHLELDCGHVPQFERPQLVHDAMARFLR